MGFALLIVGLLMVITGARGTYAQFGSQVASEFQGQNNFTYWLIALGTIGAVGYIQPLQTISRWLMTLILLSIFLSHKGFFAQFQAALKAGPKAPNVPNATNSGPGIVSQLGDAIGGAIGKAIGGTSVPNPSGQGYLGPAGTSFGSFGTFNPQLTPGSPANTFFNWFKPGFDNTGAQ